MAPKLNQAKMSVTPLPNTSRLTVWRSLLIAMIAVVVLSLQVGLPWLSCYLASDDIHGKIGRNVRPDFWRNRFRFDRILDSKWMFKPPSFHSISAIVFRDEIVVLHGRFGGGHVFQINLKTGSVKHSSIDEKKESLSEKGWDALLRPESRAQQNLRWIAGNVTSELIHSADPNKRSRIGYQWVRSFEDGHSVRQFVAVSRRSPSHNSFDLVKSDEGAIYLFNQCSLDGRWTVWRWDEDRFLTVVDQRSSLLAPTCFEAFLFGLLAVIVPMLVLALVASCIQYRLPFVSESPHQAASIQRRGLARAVDVISWGLPLLLAVVLHPGVIEWWSEFLQPTRWWILRTQVNAAAQNLTWNEVEKLQNHLFWFVKCFWPVPILPSLGFVAAAIFLGQIVWLCVSGQSFGKWLLGLKVVRSDLRRCSWDRSWLREALFFVDTLLLLSWVPGVVSILLTSKSQRIGDWVTDTIVIRTQRQK